MRTTLTWLHISDIHFNAITQWRDSTARDSLIEYLIEIFKKDSSLRPDLVFCTGDIAYGEIGTSPLSCQYDQAKLFFDNLLAACGQESIPLPIDRLFVVPGNHDINRKSVNTDAQENLTRWAVESDKHADIINQRFEEKPPVFKDAIKRLDEYSQFVRSYLPHQHDEEGRHRFTRIVNIDGLKVGIAGFNSAWSCSGPEDDRALWLAAEWQFNAAQRELIDADLRFGLMHHPVDWLNPTDRNIATCRISTDFHLWLHGHSHKSWVVPAQSNITIAAGAVCAQTSDEFGINLVRIDLTESNGRVYLHKRKTGGSSWAPKSVDVHAPDGQWPLERLPSNLLKFANIKPLTLLTSGTTEGRIPKLFGRETLLNVAKDKLGGHPFLLVYGLRGNGKTSLIKELGYCAPLAGKEPVPLFTVTTSTSADELFRQIATPLGETAEFPKAPIGDISTIAAEIKRRYPNPRPAWVWIDRAHHLLNADGFRNPQIRNLLLGLQTALGMQWHWVLELRERPPKGLIGECSCECEVSGLDKTSLAACLIDAAPAGRETDWTYTGHNLKSIYQWLGGGHGDQAHPQAIQLLIEVARGCKETPLEVLDRHRGVLEEEIEGKLLGDLYFNVLNPYEQNMLQALSLYRTSIPHDHIDALELNLGIPGAWDGLDRRCLLSSNSDHSLYFLHSFIAGWLRTRRLGYEGHGEDDEADFIASTTDEVRLRAKILHAAIATCWIGQLGGSRRATNLNIGRALEAFHHLVSAGEGGRVQSIAVELLSGNIEWASKRMRALSYHLYRTKAPTDKLLEVLEYHAVLDPEDHRVQRYLGQCWQKVEGNGSSNALKCFERACQLQRSFPPYWAGLGKILLSRGRDGAIDFLTRLELLEQDCPQAIDDHVRSIQSDCFKIMGRNDLAAIVRMTRINAGSIDSVFYVDEAKARLEANNPHGAMEILNLAEKNGCDNDYTTAIRATTLQKIDPEKANTLRMTRINAGSIDPIFYEEEARVRLFDGGDSQGAQEILDLAEKNGCINDQLTVIQAIILQKTDPEKAASIRKEKILAGSRCYAFYVEEAKVLLAAGSTQDVLEILDLAEKNGCIVDHLTAMRAIALQKIDPGKATLLRMTRINGGSSDPVFYVEEAKARLVDDDTKGALEILDLAEKNGGDNDYTTAVRATILQKTDSLTATSLRMERILDGSRNSALYSDEANVRLAADDHQGALDILDLAVKNNCADHLIEVMRVATLQKIRITTPK